MEFQKLPQSRIINRLLESMHRVSKNARHYRKKKTRKYSYVNPIGRVPKMPKKLGSQYEPKGQSFKKSTQGRIRSSFLNSMHGVSETQLKLAEKKQENTPIYNPMSRG